jgi:hypothetical protein
MMLLKVALISALIGIFGLSLFDMWPRDWRQMRFPQYVLLALQIVVIGFFGLVGVGYVLAVMGLWPLYVLQ